VSAPAFVVGVVMGLSIAAPVGPVAALAIQRTIAAGRAAGFASALGAATADALYGAIAALGFSAASAWIVAHAIALRGAGAVLLFVLGVRTWRRAGNTAYDASRARPSRGAISAYATTLLLTLTNPITVLSFAVILGAAADAAARPIVVIAGVFTGSGAWYAGLVVAAALLRARLVAKLAVVDRVTAATLFAGGVIAVVDVAVRLVGHAP
jgi:threonine/homoserine/homoserine lactone efflux protein